MRALFKMVRGHGRPGKKKSRTLTLFAKTKSSANLKRHKKPVVVPPELERPFAQA
jgi:hypothetical protein